MGTFLCLLKMIIKVIFSIMSVNKELSYKGELVHRGRIQSQGGKIEDSENWNFQLPISGVTAKDKADILKDRHPRREQKIRANAFIKAKKFIDVSAIAGGIEVVDKPISKTFMVKGSKDQRVDIEVKKGKAFI